MSAPLWQRAARRVRRAAGDLPWLAREMTTAPGFQIYGWWQSRINARFYRAVKRQAAITPDPILAPWTSRPIPKILWIYWAQGEAAAPPIVRRCIESWRRHNPGWEIRLLDEGNTPVDVSDAPDFLPRRYRADLLRLRLMAEFGGVWADATLLCHRPLDDWLPLMAQRGVFVFTDPGPGRHLSNWFIASEPGGALARAWAADYGRFVAGLDRVPRRYFMMIYALQWRLKRDAGLRAEWVRMPRLPAPPAFLAMAALEGRIPPETARAAIAAGLPLSKLSWKSDLPADRVTAFLDALETA